MVVVYVAFPHRGEDLPGAPWLGRLMRKGARSLPTVEPEPGDVMPGRRWLAGDARVAAATEPVEPEPDGPASTGPGQHRA